MQLDVDSIDLAVLARSLRRRFGRRFSAEYLEGKSLLRDAIIDELGCSAWESERLVETLEMQGHLRFPHLPDETHPMSEQEWEIAD